MNDLGFSLAFVLSALAAVFVVTPVLAYLIGKFSALGRLMAKKRFDEMNGKTHNHEGESDG